jgi:hypothetical protein
MILLGWNGAPPPQDDVASRLREAGVAQHLQWMIDGGLFAPVAPRADRPLIDGDAPVEALAHASWRARS